MKKLNNFIKEIFLINDDPQAIAKGFAVGSFVGMLPISGFQLIVTITMAEILKLNKRAATLSVFITNIITGLFIFFIKLRF